MLFRHLVPGFTSHIIVTLTLSVPGMILGETVLSFLGLAATGLPLFFAGAPWAGSLRT